MWGRFAVAFRTTFFALVYALALGVAVALILQTLNLLQARLPHVLAFGTPLHTPTATLFPTITPTAQLTTTFFNTVPTPVSTMAPAAAPALSPLVEARGFHPKSGRHIAVWMPDQFSGGSRESFETNKDIIDEISPFWYSTDASGRIYGTRNAELVTIAHQNQVLIIPTVHNIGDPGIVVSLLTNPQRRARHVQNIVDEVLARNYDGIDIDYEALDSSLRESYTDFIRELSTGLRAHDRLLTVAVHAKDSDYGGLGGFQDWKAIGPYVDRLRIMTYDYHWRGGGPGPVAPLYWIESVAEYARSVIEPSKVMIGVPFYGYDWPPNGNARALPWSDIEDLIASEQPTVNLLQRNARGPVDESYFFYGAAAGRREVWYMTDRGLESKLELVQRLDLGGIAIWQLGYEKPEFWEVIRGKLVEDPMSIQRSVNQMLPVH